MTIQTESKRFKALNGREATVERVLGARHGLGGVMLQLVCEDGARFDALPHEIRVMGKELTPQQHAKLLSAAGFEFRDGDWYPKEG